MLMDMCHYVFETRHNHSDANGLDREMRCFDLC